MNAKSYKMSHQSAHYVQNNIIQFIKDFESVKKNPTSAPKNIRGVSKKFGEQSDISTAKWESAEKRHLPWSSGNNHAKPAAITQTYSVCNSNNHRHRGCDMVLTVRSGIQEAYLFSIINRIPKIQHVRTSFCFPACKAS